MEKIISYISKNLLSFMGIAILTGTTLTTSALGVMKVANNFEKINLEVPEVTEIVPSTSPSISPTLNESVQKSSRTGISPKPVSPSALKKTIGVTPLIPISSANSSPQSNIPNTGCVITLFGNQYDVTNLRNTHSGGNIFNCGTDMSSVYQGKHGTNLSRMQQYLITSGGTTSSANTNTGGNSDTPTPSGIKKDDDDHKEEIEIHEEEREEEEKEEDHLETFIQQLLRIRVS